MEQIIKSEQVEREIIKDIESEYGVAALIKHETLVTRKLWEKIFTDDEKEFLDFYYETKAKDSVVFVISREKNISQESIVAMLHLTPYAAALRRNPPLPGADKVPCMADIVKADVNSISKLATDEMYRNRGYAKKLIASALEYQNCMKVPFTFVKSENDAFFEKYGFSYIYDKTKYELNKNIISEDMLRRAEQGEKVVIEDGVIIETVEKKELLTLAHFVNANLCKIYGLFNIRSAIYYEKLQKELMAKGGNIYQIVKDNQLLGYFTYINKCTESVIEVVFADEYYEDKYFYKTTDKEPAVMARVVNLPEMLKYIRSKGKVTIAVRVIDPIMVDNDGLFIWYIDEKGSHMVKQDEDEAGLKYRPEITVTIGELTAFFFEYIKLKRNMKFDSIYLTGPVFINEG